MSVWKTIGRRNQMVVLAVALSLGVAAASGGCYAHRLPALDASVKLEGPEGNAGGPLPFTVSVVPWNSDPGDHSGRDPAAFAKSLAELVASSRAFRSSRLEATPGSDADLVAVSMGTHCEASVIPLFTIISAGVIPTVFDGERCDGMVIRSTRPGTPAPIEVRVRHTGQTVVGWAAVVFGALPGWSYGLVGDDRRYRDLFRMEIAKYRTDIENLMSAGTADSAK